MRNGVPIERLNIFNVRLMMEMEQLVKHLNGCQNKLIFVGPAVHTFVELEMPNIFDAFG